MAVIAILAGLILSISGYVNTKAALANAETQIKAIETACESYKADNGAYPNQPLASGTSIPPTASDFSNVPSVQLNPRANGNSIYTPASPYVKASLELYEALTGDLMCTGTSATPGTKNYLTDITPNIFGRSNFNAPVSASNPVLYLADPFTNVYGYSTAYATQLAAAGGTVITTGSGYNPTFDLWCTGGQSSSTGLGTGVYPDPTLQWKDNW
jgi:type II secretory pathway pseudopilin PulG